MLKLIDSCYKQPDLIPVPELWHSKPNRNPYSTVTSLIILSKKYNKYRLSYEGWGDICFGIIIYDIARGTIS